MFHTHNHPTSALLTMLFIEMSIKLFNLNVTAELLHLCLNYDALAGNNVPIFQIDIDNNKFNFVIKTVYESNYLLKEHVCMPHTNIITDNKYVVKAIMDEIDYVSP